VDKAFFRFSRDVKIIQWPRAFCHDLRRKKARA
jgi:hypothetical protein